MLQFIRYKNVYFLLLISFYSYSQVNYDAFDHKIGYENREVLNGRTHHVDLLFIEGNHLFLDTDRFVKGQVTFKGQSYSLPLKYDVVNDLLVTPYSHRGLSFSIYLTVNLVNNFTLNNRYFVRLKRNIDLTDIYGNGYFEEKYRKKNFVLYIKYTKRLFEKLYSDVPRNKAILIKTPILLVSGRYSIISKKRDLVKLFPDKKKQIKDFFSHKKVNDQTLLIFLKTI